MLIDLLLALIVGAAAGLLFACLVHEVRRR